MKRFHIPLIMTICLAVCVPAQAQFDLSRALGGVVKAVQGFTLTDAQMAEYVKASVAQMDSQNTVLPPSDPYSIRLNKLVSGITEADGIPLNFKVYKTTDINAFACPDGSVRVFSGLMDVMDDNELLGIIGHEIGHVMKHHSKNAFKNELLTGALKDAIASTSTTAAALTDSQLSTLGQTFLNAKYSQKQENEADDCGYDFLVKNHRNPWGMVSAFEKLQVMENSSASQSNYLTKMFSSHPDTQARIGHMKERCAHDGYTAAGASSAGSTIAPKSAKATKTTNTTKTAKTTKTTKIKVPEGNVPTIDFRDL